MFKNINYINFPEITEKVIILETKNRLIDEEKIKKIAGLKNEEIKEFISTNNIEGDIINFSKAKMFLKENMNKTLLEKRWMGIKYAHDIIWSNNYTFTSEYINEAHRALLRNASITGGVWKTKINQVGSLVTAHPDDVPKLMQDLITNYLSSKITSGPSVFNIIPLISEFLAIHPYEDGNGRISRLLMNRELYDAGFKFVKYVSVSKFIWERRDEYINALESRNSAWASNTINPTHLVKLFNVILDSLIDASDVALKEQLKKKVTKLTFQNIVINILIVPLSISDIIKKLNISNSQQSVMKWLKELVNNNKIRMIGKLKTSKYIKI